MALPRLAEDRSPMFVSFDDLTDEELEGLESQWGADPFSIVAALEEELGHPLNTN